jgi:LmbE family N-acetylglucosaminyl deacetylase
MITAAHDLGTILGIWAHPDDEAYLSAGLMAGAVDAGQRVVCVTATRGELGFADDDPRPLEERAQLRERELNESFDVLGVTEHVWLDYPDGGCRDVDLDEAVGRVVELIEEIRPDTILTFPPDGGTGHHDHIAASRWATVASRRSSWSGARLYYSVRTPEWEAAFASVIPLDQVMMTDEVIPATPREQHAIDLAFDDALIERKLGALQAHASQVDGLIEISGFEAYRNLMAGEFYRVATELDIHLDR